MIYAPVIIPTLCRYEKFVNCIESLKKNTWAEYTDIYVGLDYPVKESHKDGYQKIKDYLKKNKFAEFQSLHVIERKKNKGAIGNLRDLIETCFQKYDRCICTFDDLEHSQNFLQYMDTMLTLYELDGSVTAVTGYSYPVEWKVKEGCNAVKQNFTASIWGMGLWKNDWTEMIHYVENSGLVHDFTKAYRDGKFKLMTDFAITDYVNHVAYGVYKKSLMSQFTDIALRIYLGVKGKYVIMPVVTMTRNYGFDGSGAYCQEINYSNTEDVTSENYDFSRQPIDQNNTFNPIIDKQFDIEFNRTLLNKFDKVDEDKVISAWKRVEYYSNRCYIWRIYLNIRKSFRRGIKNCIKRICGL
jgi:hypothetical protein